MEAVILAAGKSTRTQPLDTPKPLLRILDKTIIEHNLDNLTGIIDKVRIVVSTNEIPKKLGTEYKGIEIQYYKQEEQLGTGHSLRCAKPKGDFLVMMGDDLYSREDIKTIVKGGLSILVDFRKPLNRFSSVGGLNILSGISTSRYPNIPALVNTGCYVLNDDIFKHKDNLITNMISKYCKTVDINMYIVSDYWMPITYWWNYLEANQFMLKQYGLSMYIGNNVKVNRNAYLREGTILFDSVEIGGEVVDSVIMENTKAKHNCYIGHSVIGKNCNIGAGTITADYRHDAKNHTTVVKGDQIDTQRNKLGTCLANNIKTGINTTIYPCRTLERNTEPGEIIK